MNRVLIDRVLEYGEQGNVLRGKRAMSVITTGGSRAVYCVEGESNFSVTNFSVGGAQINGQ
ncbi:hypothetical protein [Lewinella sp. IMCC34191]|uniref:hypothetical protein n=1 Tax=Lewinella sp. IMCC34191 TaxID=2259172 RepID=UPI000E2286AE|nr:hypothetical protein [Lewinella sp. IMCC34191]